MNDEVSLLGGSDGASSEGSIDVQGSCLCTFWSIDDDGGYLLEGAPVAAEIGGVNFGVE